MPVKEYHKLVRDRIPDIIASEGKVVKYTHFNLENDDHYIRRLLDKLYEELGELYNTVEHDDDLGREAVIEELADVAEVFDTLAKNLGISHDEILLKMKAKAEEKGSFENGTYLIEVEEGE